MTTSDRNDGPSVDLSPVRPLLDEVVTVRVTGLPVGDSVTLRLRERHRDDVVAAAATFEADGEGVVDLTTDEPVAGDYAGVRPMGLFQFATERPGVDPSDLGGSDGSDSVVVPGELRAVVDDTVVDTIAYERVVRPASVARRPVDHPELVGDCYLPAADGPHPGVVYFGGSEGGRPGSVAPSLLAARGYAVLGLAYFGVEDLPNHLVDVPIEYFETAIEWFADRDAVRPAPVGVVSASRGSEMALTLGANVPAVSTVVVRAPGDVRFGGIWTGKPDEWESPGAAWTRNGKPLPYVPVASSPFDVVRWLWNGLRGRLVEIAYTYVDGRAEADDERVDAAAIPVAETGGPVLLVSGEDDRLWPSNEMAERLVDRLRDAGYEHRFEHHNYPDAGHAIAAPYQPVTGRETSPLFPGVTMALGGRPAGYADADADWWPRVLDVLDDGLREGSAPRAAHTAEDRRPKGQ